MKEITVIIPVFNSQDIILETITSLVEHLNSIKQPYEIILVNDGSTDGSNIILNEIYNKFDNLKIINLLKNYGQHSAILCGMKFAEGNYIITMDDDLQNPPNEISKLYHKILEGYDLVFAKFNNKMHPEYRKIGTKIIKLLNEIIFHKPKDIEITNFRIFKNDVAKRVLNHKSFDPYIPGLLLLYSSKIGNVTTEHKERTIGKSNYTLRKIFNLVSRLLFNYTTFPLNFIIIIGFIVSLLSLFLGLYFILKHILIGTSVPGWTSIAVLISFFTSIILMAFGVVGQYLIRIIKQNSNMEPYQIKSKKI